MSFLSVKKYGKHEDEEMETTNCILGPNGRKPQRFLTLVSPGDGQVKILRRVLGED